MYTNQKDQVNLENVYSDIYNEDVIPDTGFGTAIGFGLMFLVPAMDAAFRHFKGWLDVRAQNQNVKNLTQKIINKLNNDKNLQDKITEIKKEADASKTPEFTKAIKSLLFDAIKNDNDFSVFVQNKYETEMLKRILELLPNDFSNKTSQQIQKEVINNINMSPMEMELKKRQRLGINQSFRTSRPTSGF
jgi:hypothetical protein